jgi:hypothetical protein
LKKREIVFCEVQKSAKKCKRVQERAEQYERGFR